ncbi:hypothetical protein LguiA_014991 [Lonicera macranthoides]
MKYLNLNIVDKAGSCISTALAYEYELVIVVIDVNRSNEKGYETKVKDGLCDEVGHSITEFVVFQGGFVGRRKVGVILKQFLTKPKFYTYTESWIFMLLSVSSGGILVRAVEAEDKKNGNFMRLEHVEGYLELSSKTKIDFAGAVALWDVDFYVKVMMM